ncbi:hypothetical protein Pla110_13670 [Polystyrenella longa]|uniref:Uncharacterized protein n=1 Tax=Polystyrenella longa TaxID=2528007 RepID=A0A518CKA1_9PLAN|nr:hypothetical protein [Polystyrenella longa]QDU79656.1 hypothetical protein Pla110_13670 [Polystyrenella longa]
MRNSDLGFESMLFGLIGVWVFFGTAYTVTVLFGLAALFVIYAISTHDRK